MKIFAQNSTEYVLYKVPKEWRNSTRICNLYPPIPRHSRNIDFDIYDFEMLFHDPATIELIKSGRTIGCFYIESPGMHIKPP